MFRQGRPISVMRSVRTGLDRAGFRINREDGGVIDCLDGVARVYASEMKARRGWKGGGRSRRPFSEHSIVALVPLINPIGKISLIVPSEGPLPFQDAFYKAVSLHWTFMFTKPMTDTRPETQGQILKEIAALADGGVLSQDIVTERHVFGEAALKTVHAKVESGKGIGKIVLVRA
ncbi:hypothetical protein BDK51DRAFT_44512 [Blyttiomyces helicus]|uniref:Alcohol dehydrogenase-like C-terminal domain-containing protein n=1 Tax=Blyttiomyces helicus TaxID=388810 RepID=A0A4P9WCY9_9FUNG|nr:hypothetical protein BDK51DRAFT_44512 [Blyttiomyces helicus]|eukprot:RKO88790.1 hypothetical protein BDK51DRAFT_44512 [Blyttiomyces helicus]